MTTPRRPTKAKIPYFGNPNKATFVEENATVGATLGTNFFGPDGVVLTVESLAELLGVGASSSSESSSLGTLAVTIWRLIREVPIYTTGTTSPNWVYTLDGAPIGSVGYAAADNGIATGSLAGDLVLAPVDGRAFVDALTFLNDAPLIIQREVSDVAADYVGFQLNGRHTSSGLYGGIELRLENSTTPSDGDLGGQIGLWEGGAYAVNADGVVTYPPSGVGTGFRWRHEASVGANGDLVFYSHLGSATGTEIYRHRRDAAQMIFAGGSATAPTIAFDSNTGLYSGTAGTLRMTAGGVQVLGAISTSFNPTVPVRNVDGTSSAPSYSFSADNDTGMHRPATNELGFSTGASTRLTISTTAFTAALPWLGQNGTETAPALSFSGDTNTGIYLVSADLLGFTIGGTQRLRISTAQFTATLPWRGQDGTVGAPALSFSGDTDTGIYVVSANTLGVTAGNSLVASFSQAEIELNATLFDFNGEINLSGLLTLDSAAPTLRWYETDVAADQRLWQLDSFAGAFRLTSRTDAGSVVATPWTILHDGSALTIAATAINLPGTVTSLADVNTTHSMIIDNDSNGTANAARLVVASGDANVALFMCGSGRTSPLVTNGPVGAQFAMRTLGAQPFIFATDNTSRARISYQIALADDATGTFDTGQFGLVVISSTFGVGMTAIVWQDGTTLRSVDAGASTSVGTAGSNPDVDGNMNIWKSAAGTLSIKNRIGSTRGFIVTVLSEQ